jgi:periplasmic protein TonB
VTSSMVSTAPLRGESITALVAPTAIEDVKQWRYRPFLLNGEPVEVETMTTVNFEFFY